MKQKIEKVIRNKKVAIALMECSIAIGCIVIFCLFMIPKDRIPDTTHSYSKVEKVTKYKVVDNYMTRVMPLTDYKTFKEIAENTLNNGLEGKNYTVKVYSDAEKTKEVTSGYIVSGMIVEATVETEKKVEESRQAEEPSKIVEVTEEKSTEAVVENEEKETELVVESGEEKLENGTEEEVENNTKEEVEGNEESKVEENKEIVSYRISVIGDMTKDGDINVTELTKITKCIIGLSNWSFTKEEKLASDLNGDGQIDITDIESCINYIVFGELDIQEEKYTVTFKDYDGSVISTKTSYHYGDKIEVPNDPTRETDETYSYEFTGWNPEITEAETVTGNAEYIATYRMVANKAKYAIEHYKQELDGTYELAETEELTGTTGQEVTATAKEYTGFTEDTENEERVAEGTIVGDGSLVLKLYYKRNEYNLNLNKDENIESVTGAGTYKYGATVSINATLKEEAGYEIRWNKWVSSDANLVVDNENQNATIEIPAGEVTLTATTTKESKTDTAYKVEHYKEKLDGTYELAETEELTGTTDSIVTAVAKEYIGYTEDTENEERVAEGTIVGDGSLVLKLYYKRNEYKLNLNKDENIESVIGAGTYKYGETVSINATLKEEAGYEIRWDKWTSSNTELLSDQADKETNITMPAGEVTLTATTTKEAKNDTAYKVEHYKEKLDGTYELAETEELTGTTGEEVTAVAKTYEGFTEDTEKEERVAEGTIAGDGSLVLKLYYKRNEYTIIFKNDNGTEISNVKYKYEERINIPDNPTKEEDETYTYEFSGWTPEVAAIVTDNAEYIATYESTYREYTIIFEDYDGTVISEKTDYHYGDIVSVPEEPTRVEDETYTYEFAGWDKEITEVTKNTTYIATYINKYKEYTITFKQDTGDIINSSTYHYGDSVQIPENPVKESTVEYAYTFSGWTPEVEETVTKSAEYTATYEEQVIEYNFIFYNDDGVTEVARIENYRWGDNIKLPTAPTKEPTEEINYVFSEWKNLGVEEVSKTQKNIRFMAQYTEEYFVARLMETETLEGVSYLTLEEAVENAGDDVRKIKLLQDTQESVMIEDNQNITLDLNGKTITGTKAYAIRNYGILTVTDETEEKEGKIKESATSSLGYGIHNRDGKVTIKSGMIVTETTQESGTTYGIYNQSEETLVIEGGSIIAEAKGESATSCGIYNLAGKEIVISGGTVLGNAIAGNSTSYGIYNATEGIINVTNGSVEGKASLASATSYGIYNAVSENVTINGGTVVAQSDKSIAYGVYNKKGKISVLGGTIEVTAAQGYGVYNEIGTVEVQAGKITMVGTTSYGIYNVGSIEVSGGEIELLASNSYGIYNNGQMSVTGGTINSKNANTGYGIYNNSSLNTSIENTTISGTNYGIYNNKGILTVTNSNITAVYGIYTYGSNTNTIVESANITSTTYGIYNDYGNIILRNANIVSEQYGVYNNNTGNVEIGVKDQNISVENPNIYGKTYAIYNNLTSSGAIKYYDGVLTGEMAIYGGVNEIEDNSQIVIQINEEGFEVATLQSIEQGNVAKIGETEYKSLAEAVESVEENAEEDTVIQLIIDFEISKAVEIPENKNVTIDLAGCEVTTYAKGGMTNKGTLKITDSTEESLGKIISGIGIGISNEGNLTIESGTIESNAYGIYNYSDGNVIIQGGTIQGISYGVYNNSSLAIITVEDGEIKSDSYGIYNVYGTANIAGGQVKGSSYGIYNIATTNILGGQVEGSQHGIYNYSGTTNVTGGLVKGNSYGIYNIAKTNVTGGKVEGNSVGIYNKQGTIVIGTKGSNVDNTIPVIIGKDYGISSYYDYDWGNTLKYYDGKIAGQTKAIYESVTEVEEGKQIQINTETINEAEYQVTSLVDEEVNESGIAQIGDNVYTTVSSLKQAISKISINTTEAVEVTILNDFYMTQEIVIASNQNVKINLNGKTITATSAINNNGTLEITDETENHEGKLNNTNKFAIINCGGNLVITKGTIEGAYSAIYQDFGNVTLGIEDGDVDDNTPIIIGKVKGIEKWTSDNTLKMYDGIIKGKSNYSSPTQTEEGYKIHNYQEDGYYITAIELESPIARTGGQDYNSLQAAIDACSNGSTVEILRSVDNIKNTVTVGEDKNIVLDLKGYTINSSSEKTLINNGTLSIATSSGTINNTNSNGITIENNGEINLSNGSVSSDYGTAIENNGEINLSNGSVRSNYGKAVQNNGTLNVAGGTINGKTYGIYNNENATLTISSGNIYSYQYCIYNNSTNTIPITGGNIYLYSGYYSSHYGIYNNVDADINMTGGSIYNYVSSNSEYVYGIYNKANGNVLISTSGAIMRSSSGYGYGVYNNAEGTVTLQKGTISVNSQYLGYGIRNTYKGKVEITGGSINVTSNDGYAYGIENGSLGNAEVTNGNISVKTNTGTAYGIRNISLNPLKIKNGTIKATGAQSYGIYNNTSDLVIGENDESVSSDSPVIESDFVGIYINELGTKFGFYDGKVIAKQAINVDANVPEGYRLLKYFDKEKQKEVAILSELDNYVLTYYLNGEKYESVILKSGSSVPEKRIEEEGYEFSGWQNLPETMPEEDIDTYGTLTLKTYTITYYVDGEQYGEVDTFEYKSEVTPRELPTKEGYEFSGWSEIPETMPAEDIEVRGVFTYTATFYNEDKTSVIGTVPFTVNDTVLQEPEIPEKEGYIGKWSSYEIQAQDLEIQAIYVEIKAVINKTKVLSYDSIETAVASVDTDGTQNEIFLTQDVTTEATSTISENANVVLDLNGYTITNNTTYCGMDNYGKLELTDSSNAQTGNIIVQKADTDVYGIYNRENASANIVAGNINVTASEGNTGTGIYNEVGAIVTLGTKDGAVSTTIPHIKGSTYGINNTLDSTLNFYDGKIEGTTAIKGEVNEAESGYRTVTTTNSQTNLQECYLEKILNGTKLQATDENGITWNYTYQDGEATNVYYESGTLGKTVTIPAKLSDGINEYTVVSLYNTGGSYRNIFTKTNNGSNTTVNKVIIPEGVTSIGDSAFRSCSSLTSVEIPNSVTSIGSTAFVRCSNLTSVNIPSTVTSIGGSAFGNSGLTSVVIEEGVTSIGTYAFSNCSRLKSVVIEEGITSIGESTFHECRNLTSVEIPNSVTSIEKDAFYNCRSLTSLEIPEGVTSIGDFAFYYCSSLKSVNIPSTVTSIGSYAFDNSGLTSVVIEEGVTSIGYTAFYECRSLRSVEIPSSVTSIGNSAFSGCSSLASVEIPSSVTSIGNLAFYACSSLASVEIPSSVTSIASGAFSTCSSLTSLKVAEDNTNYSSENDILYNKNKTELIQCAGGKEGEVIIPEGVTSIGDSAFQGCSSLTSVEIPTSVTAIGSSAFNICRSLTSVEIPTSVTNIGSSAFWYCSSLTNVEIPSSVTSIGGNAFSSCSSLTDIYVDNLQSNLTLGSSWSGNAYVHYNECKHNIIKNIIETRLQLQEVSNNLENGIIECGETYQFKVVNTEGKTITNALVKVTSQGKFTNSAEVTEKILPNEEGIYTIENINRNKKIVIGMKNGEVAQYTDENGITWNFTYKDGKATNIYYESGTLGKTVEIPSTLYGYPVESLYNTGGNYRNIFTKTDSGSNTTVEKVIIPEGVTSIGDYAFYKCYWLTSAVIQEGLTSIGERAFYDCNRLTSIVIPEGVTNIGERAFYECTSLSSIEIPSSVTSIGDDAFGYCSSLKSVVIAEGVTSIPGCAFYYCRSLTSVEIPSSVTSIGSNAFGYCSSLKSVNIPSSVTNIGGSAFDSCSSLTSIVIPEGVTRIGGNAFSGCSSLTNVEIPSSVTSIGSNAFSSCSSLTNVEIPSSVTSIESNAFGYCKSLTNVEIPSSVTNIERWAFRDCSSLTDVVIPEGVTSIEERVFYNCSSLTNVEIPSSVTTIGDYAFNGCSSLTSVVIPERVTRIKSYAFGNCSSLTSIEIPRSVTSIESYVFSSCNRLTDIYVNNIRSNLGIGSSWSGNAKVHYSDCTHNIIKETEEGIEIEDITDNLTDGKIACREEYRFKIVDQNGNTVTDKRVRVVINGASQYITPNEERIYTLEEVVRDITITTAEIQNGGKVKAKDENGITWNYTYQEGEATNVYYESGKLPEIVTIPSELDGNPVVSLYNTEGNYRNIFTKTNSGTNTTVKKVIIPEGVTSIGSYAFAYCSALTDIYINNLVSNLEFGSDWNRNTYAYVHYSDCKHTITPNIETGLQIQEVGNKLEAGQIKCRETYSFKVLDEEGENITNIEVKLTSEGEFTNSSEVTKIITPNEEGIYTINSVERNISIIVDKI